MQLISSLTIAITALSATSSAFVMTTYSGSGCSGSTQHVNVWDGTCAAWPSSFRSFKITTWGGNHQKAYFFTPNNCGSLPGAIKSGYVDATTKNFKINECVSFNNQAANAVASYAG